MTKQEVYFPTPANGWFTLIITAVVIAGLVMMCNDETAEPVTREAKIEQQFSKWDGSHFQLVATVKKKLRDPDSFQHIETVYNASASTIDVGMTFKSKNAFGGYVMSAAKGTYSIDGYEVIPPEIVSE
jgi:hypothetical protein